MCLLVLAWRVHPRYRLVVAANRDEFHERPAAALARWTEGPDILGGKDLSAGGTWLALDASRRFGVVTNFRDLQRPAAHAPSRGELIPGFLAQPAAAGEFLRALAPEAPRYSGFNLLLSDERALWYASNRAQPFARELSPGLYGLSNHLLDTPWPKLARVRRAFRAWLDGASDESADRLLEILADRTPAGAEEPLPETGLGEAWERVLSAPFVLHPQYGTRCSTVLMIAADGALSLRERRFDASGVVSGDTDVRLAPGAWAGERAAMNPRGI